ncbi:cytochrome C-type biogenesis protein (ccdA), conjectural [uncultured Synechococcales cyanobacterium]|uniref:Cytochrome C-type biogenesis protein (CcdA), conjectural n=1 Tax=uncultured Synechococcales cyanobacterium TaxID=1936017 RepID=A0A6J4UV01_9CYAN|nr:cytochrome C-type biogenesis protein (ccdA), conjectural [uncultured Synechococcales cyanobacterium]
MPPSPPSIGLALLAGVLAVLSPCVLPVMPLIIGRSLQSHRYGPLALVVGLIAGFAAIGSLLGVTASWFAGLATALRTSAITLLLVAGVLAIFPKLSYRLFSYLRLDRWLQAPSRVGLVGEFWLGTQLGLLWTPCAGPVLGSILLLAAVEHDARAAFVLLSAYGLGSGLPLLAIAYSGRYLSQHLLGLRSHSAKLQRVGGVIVVMSAIAIFLGWDIQIQLWLAPIFPTLLF